MRYRIFPPIGIARLGGDSNFIVGPERPGSGPIEIQANGTEIPARSFKDATRTKIRKEGARFHIFESPDGSTWTPANLPAGATVTWKVSLQNKKAAVQRPANPPIVHTRPVVPAGNEAMAINGGTQQIGGANAASAPLAGTYKTTSPAGAPFQAAVELGQLRTDGKGRLIVLGGSGISGAPDGVAIGPSFYRNPKWFDDVSDGPVDAEIRLSAISPAVQAEGGAWVVVAPPDFAPGIACAITLFDVVRQLGIEKFGLPHIAVPSFDLDIAPIVERVRRLRFVHANATWSDARLSSPNLRSKAPADQQLRNAVLARVLSVENIFQGHTDPNGPVFRLRDFQRQDLTKWASGNFDATAIAPPAGLTATGLTQAALENCAGQGFCPGIEAGIIVLDETIWINPFDFRLNHASISAGDITALMAQPWQADFLKCNTEWWPTQRPDLAPQADGTKPPWNRGATTHKLMVQRSARLGFVVKQGASEVFLEMERDPAL